jgi:hypothetical protein
MANGVLYLGVEVINSGNELARDVPVSANPLTGVEYLAKLFGGLSDQGAVVRVSADESSPKAASTTVVLTQASLTAGDEVRIGSARLVAVAGAANAALGQWSIDTSSTLAAASLALAINTFPTSSAFLSATSSTGTVTVTAKEAGTIGNEIRLSEVDASGGIAITTPTLINGTNAFTPGRSVGAFTGQPTATQTLVLGAVTLTYQAGAPANENQVQIGGSTAATTTNTIAAINAHSLLKGVVLATAVTSTSFALDFKGFPLRTGVHFVLSETADNFTWSVANLGSVNASTVASRDTAKLAGYEYVVGSIVR